MTSIEGTAKGVGSASALSTYDYAATLSVLQYARVYAEQGWTVIPLVPFTRRPAVPWKGYQTERPTDDQLVAWFDKPGDTHGIGIVTGALSDLIVLDVDVKNGVDGEKSFNELDLPWSLMVATWSGGVHVYYAHPGSPVPNAQGRRPGLDVRGDGGFVVAPPSMILGCLKCSKVHDECKCGDAGEDEFGLYSWTGNWRHKGPLVLFPGIPEEPKPVFPTAAPRRFPRLEKHGSGYAAAALRNEALAVVGAAEGARNDTLNKAAFSLGRLVKSGELKREDAEVVLRDAAAAAGLSEHEIRATIRSGLESR